MPWPDLISLKGEHVRLEPLAQDHRAGLSEAVKDGELWSLVVHVHPEASKR